MKGQQFLVPHRTRAESSQFLTGLPRLVFKDLLEGWGRQLLVCGVDRSSVLTILLTSSAHWRGRIASSRIHTVGSHSSLPPTLHLLGSLPDELPESRPCLQSALDRAGRYLSEVIYNASIRT